MQTAKESKSTEQRKHRKKLFKTVFAILVIVFFLVLLVVPAYVSSDSGRKTILAKINNSVDGQMDFADISMGWFSGIKIDDLQFQDGSGRMFASVKQISTHPHYISLLTGNLSFGKTIIDQPIIETIADSGTSVPHTGSKSDKVSSIKSAPLLPVKKIDLLINDGKAKITDLNSNYVEISQINSRLNLRPPGSKTEFDINMVVSDKTKAASLRAEGNIKPTKSSGWTLQGSTGDLAIEVNDLNIDSLAPLLALAGVDIKAKGKLSANIETQIKDGSIVKLTGNIKGKNLDLDIPQLKGDRLKTETLDIAVKLIEEKGLINIETLNIKADWLTAKAKGVVPTSLEALSNFLAADSEYDLQVDFDCDVARTISQMPTVFGLKEETKITSGKLTGNIATFTEGRKRRIVGKADLVNLRGTVQGKNVGLSAPLSVQANITSDKAGIKYEKLSLSSDFAKIDCVGTDSLLQYNADIELGKFQNELGQLVEMRDYQLAGEITSNGKIIPKEDIIYFKTDSTKIKDFKMSVPGQELFFQKLISVFCDAAVNTVDKTYDVKYQLKSEQIDIKGRLQKTNKASKTRIEANADCKYDWAAVSNLASSYLPKGLKLYGKRTDPINFVSEYPIEQPEHFLANLNTQADLGFDKAEYMGLNFGPTDIEIKVQNGILQIAPFSATVNQGKLNFAANADFNQKPPLLKTPTQMQIVENIQINDEISEKLLRYINPLFANSLNVSGTANFNCEKLSIPLAAASQKDIEIIGTISMENVRLQPTNLLSQILSLAGASTSGQNITMHPTRFVVSQGFCRYEDMQIDIGDNPVNFKGLIGLDKTLDMKVVLPYTTRGRTVRVGRQAEGSRIILPLKGTIDNPELDTGKLLEEQLIQRLEDELRKGLEKLLE